MKRSAIRAVLLFLVALLAVPALWATTAVERSEADLIQESTLIVTGHCTHLQSQWVGRILVTLATIQVSETLKGSPSPALTVVLPGGVDSHRKFPVAMSYPAAPEIFQQEDVLLFLNPENLVAGDYSIVGFSQGKFTLATTTQGQQVATQDLSALNLQDSGGMVRRGKAKTIVLDELRSRLRAAGGPR